MGETNNGKPTEVTKMTITTTDPTTGKTTTDEFKGEGVVFGFLRGEECDDNGRVFNITAGVMGRFNDEGVGAVLGAIEESIYSESPQVQVLREFQAAVRRVSEEALESDDG